MTEDRPAATIDLPVKGEIHEFKVYEITYYEYLDVLESSTKTEMFDNTIKTGVSSSKYRKALMKIATHNDPNLSYLSGKDGIALEQLINKVNSFESFLSPSSENKSGS